MMPVVAEECAGAARLDDDLVGALAGPPQRPAAARVAGAGRNRRRHHRDRGVVDRPARRSTATPWLPDRHRGDDRGVGPPVPRLPRRRLPVLHLRRPARRPGRTRRRGVLPPGVGRRDGRDRGGRRRHLPSSRRRPQPGPVPAGSMGRRSTCLRRSRRPSTRPASSTRASWAWPPPSAPRPGPSRTGRGRRRALGSQATRPEPARDSLPSPAYPGPGGTAISILVIDVGTSSVRAAIVRPDATVAHVHRRPLPPSRAHAGPGGVRPRRHGRGRPRRRLRSPGRRRRRSRPLGITAQRASAIAWDARTGAPARTRARAGRTCARSAPAWSCKRKACGSPRPSPPPSSPGCSNRLSPRPGQTAMLGTVDTWLAWQLSGGALHITDASNAAVTGLYRADGRGWRREAIDRLGHSRRGPAGDRRLVGVTRRRHRSAGQPAAHAPSSATSRRRWWARAAPGPVWPRPPSAPAPCSTCAWATTRPGVRHPRRGRVLPDHRLAAPRPAHLGRRGHHAGRRHRRRLAGRGPRPARPRPASRKPSPPPARTPAAWSRCPPCSGYGTPQWDFGARGALFGLTRGTGRPEVVRAVLEGVAHSGADLLEAAERDAGRRRRPPARRRRHERQPGVRSGPGRRLRPARSRCRPQLEATTLGAGLLAGLAVGTWSDLDDVAAHLVAPGRGRAVRAPADRDRWRRATERAARWYPELSALSF